MGTRSWAPYKKLAGEQGWTVKTTGSGHLHWDPPGAEVNFVITSSTPGTQRSMTNDLQNLKNAGLELDARKSKAIAKSRRATTPTKESPMAEHGCRHCPDRFQTRRQRDDHEQFTCKRAAAYRVEQAEKLEAARKEQAAAQRNRQKNRRVICPGCDRATAAQNLSSHMKKNHIDLWIELTDNGTKRLHPEDAPEGMQPTLKGGAAVKEREEARRERHHHQMIENDPGILIDPEPPPVTPTIADRIEEAFGPDVIERDTLINMVFPNGIPKDPVVLVALADWIGETDKFLAIVRGDT